jgi:hypothetical protein
MQVLHFLDHLVSPKPSQMNQVQLVQVMHSGDTSHTDLTQGTISKNSVQETIQFIHHIEHSSLQHLKHI